MNNTSAPLGENGDSNESNTVAHFLLTRFNVVRPFTDNKPILDHDWLNRRFELFERFCFPSVAGQTNNNFYWIILFHPQTPDIFMQRLNRLWQGAPHLKILTGGAFKILIINQLKSLEINQKSRTLITTRLDNDDAICQNFIGKIQQQTTQEILEYGQLISKDRPLFLDFTKGYYAAGKYLYQIDSVSNHFCSMACPLQEKEKWNTQEIQTVFLMNHTLIKDQPGYKEINEYPAWIEVIHESNSRNCLRGKFIPCSDFESPFSINWSPTAVSNSERKERNVLDLPFSVEISNSLGRLNYLRKTNSAQYYLEIGEFGWKHCIGAKEFTNKTFVSPIHISRDLNKNSSKKNFYPIKGHDFFRKDADNYPLFDLIRLGESRSFDDTLSLLNEALKKSCSLTIFIFDNTFPVSKAASLSDYERHKAALQETKDCRIAWMGDNYKLVFALHDFFPQLSYATMARYNQTIAWFKSREPVKPTFESMEAIAALTYDDFLTLQEHFNIEEDFKSILKIIDYDLNVNNDIFDALNTD